MKEVEEGKPKTSEDSGAIVPVDGAAETGLAASLGAGTELGHALLTRSPQAWAADFGSAMVVGALLHWFYAGLRFEASTVAWHVLWPVLAVSALSRAAPHKNSGTALGAICASYWGLCIAFQVIGIHPVARMYLAFGALEIFAGQVDPRLRPISRPALGHPWERARNWSLASLTFAATTIAILATISYSATSGLPGLIYGLLGNALRSTEAVVLLVMMQVYLKGRAVIGENLDREHSAELPAEVASLARLES